MIVEEYGNQLKGQTAMDTSPVAAVDMETGEVLEDTVVDFRKVKGE